MSHLYTAGLAALLWLPGEVGALRFANAPYSRVEPSALGLVGVERSGVSAPLSERWATGKRAHPTNAWWLSLALTDTPGDSEANAFVMPYVVWAAAGGICAAMPFVMSPDMMQVENGFDPTVLHVFLGAAEKKALGGHEVVDHDEMVVTLGWRPSPPADPPPVGVGGSAHTLTTPIARGSPFITAEYAGTTPLFESPQVLDPQMGLMVDGLRTTCNRPLSGSTFELVFVQSDETCAPQRASARAREPPPRAALTPRPRRARAPAACGAGG